MYEKESRFGALFLCEILESVHHVNYLLRCAKPLK